MPRAYHRVCLRHSTSAERNEDRELCGGVVQAALVFLHRERSVERAAGLSTQPQVARLRAGGGLQPVAVVRELDEAR